MTFHVGSSNPVGESIITAHANPMFSGGDTSCPCCFRPGLDRPNFCMPAGGGSLTTSSKIDGIRQLLKIHGIGAYIQPMGDAHT